MTDTLATWQIDLGRHGVATCYLRGLPGPRWADQRGPGATLLEDVEVHDAHGHEIDEATIAAWLADLDSPEADDVGDWLWRLAADAYEWDSCDPVPDRYDVLRGAWVSAVAPA